FRRVLFRSDFYDVSINPKLLKLVPQCPEGDAQRGCGLGLVVTVLAQRVLEGGALDLLDVRGQGAGGGVARVQRARIDALGRGGGVRGDRLGRRSATLPAACATTSTGSRASGSGARATAVACAKCPRSTEYAPAGME